MPIRDRVVLVVGGEPRGNRTQSDSPKVRSGRRAKGERIEGGGVGDSVWIPASEVKDRMGLRWGCDSPGGSYARACARLKSGMGAECS